MMGQMFAPDQYGQQQQPSLQQARQRQQLAQQIQQVHQAQQQQRLPFAQQQQPSLAPGSTPADPAASSFNTMNAAFGPTPQQAPSKLGGNLGLSGIFDPSNWNTGLPSGSLTGGY